MQGDVEAEAQVGIGGLGPHDASFFARSTGVEALVHTALAQLHAMPSSVALSSITGLSRRMAGNRGGKADACMSRLRHQEKTASVRFQIMVVHCVVLVLT
nr:hypothetical protein [Burkholderia sp. BCC1977]